MEPLTQFFNRPVTEVRNNFLKALKKGGIAVLGRNDALGMISFTLNGSLFYVHFVETSNNTAKIDVAAGLSYMKDRDDGEMPAGIKELMNTLKKQTSSTKPQSNSNI